MKRRWDQFWFEAEGHLQVAAFRKCFVFLVFISYFSRSFDLSFFYSDTGILKRSAISEIFELGNRSSLLIYLQGWAYLPEHWILWICHGIFLLSLLMMVLGYFPRIAHSIALILHLSFIHRNIFAQYGMDSLSNFFLFYLCMHAWGISSWNRGPNSQNKSSGPSGPGGNGTRGNDRREIGKSRPLYFLSSLAFRLMQIQVCIIYVYSGMQKLRGLSWWDGNALWFALMNPQSSHWDFASLSHFPGLIFPLTIGAYSTVLWELYFPILVLNEKLKLWVLGAGVFLHLVTGVLFHIPLFGLSMIVMYLLFLNSKDLKQIELMFSKIGFKTKVGRRNVDKSLV